MPCEQLIQQNLVNAKGGLSELFEGGFEVNEVSFSGLVKHAEGSNDMEAAALGSGAAGPFIDQKMVGVEFFGEAYGLSFTGIESNRRVDEGVRIRSQGGGVGIQWRTVSGALALCNSAATRSGT